MSQAKTKPKTKARKKKKPQDNTVKARQSNYSLRQREMGRKARKFWLTDEERATVAGFIEQMRQEQQQEKENQDQE